jgi:hypothetical protein
MIIRIDDRRGSRWPVPLVLAAVCVLAIIGAGFLHQRSLDRKVAAQEAKANALVRQTIAPSTRGVDLTKPLPHAVATRLTHDLVKGPLAADVILRVRIFAQDGSLLFSTDPEDPGNGARVGDADSIRAAAVGTTTSLVATDRVSSPQTKPTSVELLQTYLQLSAGRGKLPGVVGIDQRYAPIAVAALQPWHTIQLGLAAAAAVLVVVALLLLARRASVKRAKAKGRAAARTPAQDAQASEPSEASEKKGLRREKPSSGPPGESDAERARKATQREIQVREALEGQLEQLRTRIREQEDLANRQVLELTQQLQIAAARVEEAEARAASAPSGADAARLAEAEGAVQDAAKRADAAQARAVAAEARVAELEERLADATRATLPPPVDERVEALERALTEARTEAADNARRAEATEAVRDELEVKVAQYGSRAQEQEATATALAEQLRQVEAVRADLERRASEAETGGDAVRSEVAQLSAERDSLKARVAELEQVRTVESPIQPAAGIQELEQLATARTELADVRQQLGQAIERVQAAEERGAKLEADLLAERQGVRELADVPQADAYDEPTEPSARPADRPVDRPSDGLVNPFPWMNGNGNGVTPAEEAETPSDPEPDEGERQGDKSLRYRLAQSAARKKGLGDLDLPS